jgi:alpha-L-fucosidase
LEECETAAKRPRSSLVPAADRGRPQADGAKRQSAAYAGTHFPLRHRDTRVRFTDRSDRAPWELTRGLGNSFGYNAQETAADTIGGEQLVHLLVDIVSKGGNLLINVGPDGRGRIPDLQREPLAELGEWLDANGEAIFETRPWSQTATSTADGHPVRFTHKNGAVYLIVLANRLSAETVIRNLTASSESRFRLLGDARDLA